MYRRYGKRLLDVTLAGIALIVLSPLMLVLTILVYFRLGAPVLFCHRRPGLDGKPFTLRKFRTMTNACGPDGKLLPDAQRLNAFGRWLRSTSCDELPELWNVLKGDMSLIGPRPLRMEYLELYTPEQARRHAMRPGITGWAQIHGRNEQDWAERFRLDVWYVDHCSLWLDLYILGRTVATVLRRDGISAEGHATKPAFTGTAD